MPSSYQGSTQTRAGTAMIPKWVKMNVPGDLMWVMQDLSSVMLTELENGTWVASAEAVELVSHFVRARHKQLNPDGKELEPELIEREARTTVGRMVNAYNEYVQQEIGPDTGTVLWVP